MYTPNNILLTGGAGFIGSHVVATLAMHAEYKARLQKALPADSDPQLSCQVVVLDKLDYCSSMRNLESIEHLLNVKVRR